MKTQGTQFLNEITMKPVYGIKVFYLGQWMNAAENGKPLLFDSESERDQKQAEIRKNGYDKEDRFNAKVARGFLKNYQTQQKNL